MEAFIELTLYGAPFIIIGICAGLALLMAPRRRGNGLQPLLDFLVLETVAWSWLAFVQILAPEAEARAPVFRLLSLLAFLRLSLIVRGSTESRSRGGKQDDSESR